MTFVHPDDQLAVARTLLERRIPDDPRLVERALAAAVDVASMTHQPSSVVMWADRIADEIIGP